MTKLLSAAAFLLVTGTDVHVVSQSGQAKASGVRREDTVRGCQRAFFGGINGEAACQTISWRLALGPARNGSAPWSVTAIYWVPPASTPNAMVDGPRVALKGTLTMTKGTKFHASA